jgi:pyruvate formate lyase activating enzyme
MTIDNTTTTGTVLEIQRMSTEDGPGIRTTVFMKGCPMKCLWCHNPESISPLPQTQWIGLRCIGCNTCLDICPNKALSRTDKGIIIDRDVCKGCGSCAEACPGNALERIGKEWTVNDLVHELVKDRAFFQQSGGGITVSGGESTLQWKFVAALLKELKQQGIHTAIDTCGLVKYEALDAILPFTDIVLYDLKEGDPKRHQECTHSPLEPVLETLNYISGYMKTNAMPKEMWIRTPLIPDTTARPENLTKIGNYIVSTCNGTVSRWDLLAFNNLCKDKYLRLGLDWPLKDAELLTRDTMEHLAEVARRSGVDPQIVQWSGATRLTEDERETLTQQPSSPTCGC